jgi:GNAT superfamily N-acetyltransferase
MSTHTTTTTTYLRAATLPDIDEIATIWHDGWFDGHQGHVPDELIGHRTAAEFRRRIGDRIESAIVAVRHDAKLAGFVVVVNDEVEQLYVTATARGSGTAARLLAHGEQTIGRTHAVAWLAVVSGNTRARRFYERRGWNETGPILNPAETSTGTMLVPALRYEKTLTVIGGAR